MSVEQTTLEWGYEPADFFEAPFEFEDGPLRLSFDDGIIRCALAAPQDPVPDALRMEIETYALAVLDARALLKHIAYKTSGFRVRYTQANRGNQAQTRFVVGCSGSVAPVGNLGIVVIRADGTASSDSKIERISCEEATVKQLASAAVRDTLLRALIGFYQTAINNPDKELAHLYDVYDALKDHYRGKEAALQALGPAIKPHWERLHKLANGPYLQGRHRGLYLGQLRSATSDELTQARESARVLIEAYARAIS